jgi:DNA modification methylase
MNRLQILAGDCRDILPTLEAGSVQTCITSPPYWGLRDYGTAQWEGGNTECDHIESINGMSESNTLGRPDQGGMTPMNAANISKKRYFKHICGHCGARRIDAQLGLEATPEEYLANMVAVFREVWRVLRDDGTLWVNMGDSYANGGNQTTGYNEPDWIKIGGACNGGVRTKVGKTGLKNKDLCMMPARLAMALQADGWYLRSEIVWHKPNPMPESVTDRPTKAHEMIYLLTKRERYFYDAEAISEPSLREGDIPGGKHCFHEGNAGHNGYRGDGGMKGAVPATRNKRSVWTIATQPYPEAHFATFPEEIPKLCILAGSRVGDTVIDPFAGSGTTGQVALELGSRAILIELNPAYIELAEDRTFVTPGFL